MNNSLQKTGALLIAVTLLMVSSVVAADDADDALEAVMRWAELENDLEKQAELIRDDRIMIFGMNRWTDQAQNLRVQLAQDAARRNVDPDGYAIATLESPTVRVYGNTAVVSFVRIFNVIPGNAAPSGPPGRATMTAVMVKERGGWKMAHLHGSTN